MNASQSTTSLEAITADNRLFDNWAAASTQTSSRPQQLAARSSEILMDTAHQIPNCQSGSWYVEDYRIAGAAPRDQREPTASSCNNGWSLSIERGQIMKKILPLAAVGLSLLTLTAHSFFSPGSSVAASALQEVTPTPTTTREPAPAPSLTVDEGMTLVNDLDGDEIIDPGDTIKYTITYENTGDVDATKVTIVDDYNQAFIASITNISGEGKKDGDTIIWDLGTVGAGAGGSVTYEVTLKDTLPPGSITIENTVTIASNETGSVSATNTILVKGPNLTVLKEKKLVKDLDADETIDPGDTIRYTITYENTGEVDATKVTIVDDYNQALIASITNISDNGKENGDTIIWELGTVEAGAGDSVTYEATLKDTFPRGFTSIENTATIASAEIEPASAQVSLLVEVPPTPTTEPTPTPGPTPTPEPPPEPDDEGPKAGIFAEMPLIPSILIGFLAVVATFVLVYVGACAQYSSNDKDKHELSHQRIAMVREGVFLIFIVSAILILAIGEGIAEDGAISILSAIVGYVFGREATRPR